MEGDLIEQLTEEDRRAKVGELRMNITEIDRQIGILNAEKKRLMDRIVLYETKPENRRLN